MPRVLIKDKSGNHIRFNASVPDDDYAKSYQRIRPLPEQIGTGRFVSVSLGDGLGMGMCSGRFNRDYTAEVASPGPLFYFVFSIKGQTLSRNSCHSDSLVLAPGFASIYFSKDPVYERIIPGEQEMLTLSIGVPPDYLAQLLASVQQPDGPFHNVLETALSSSCFYVNHIMTPEMATAFLQVQSNAHRGRIGKIYLESKALELIALKLEQVYQGCPDQKYTQMSHEKREQIYRARDILDGRLLTPPSLKELAAMVGMSHVWLTRGFKTVFGCTVFEYLRKKRLSYARKLIEKNPDDLTRIAYESGFCSSSHFAASFFKAYGLRPSEYRKAVIYKSATG